MYQACCFNCDTTATVEDLMEMFDYDDSCCLGYKEFYYMTQYVRENVNPNWLFGLT